MNTSDLIEPIMWLLFALVATWPSRILARKAGYSNGFAWMLAALTAVTAGMALVVFLLWLVFKVWPVHRELAYARVRAGIGSQEEAYQVLEHASDLVRKFKYEDAAHRYRLVRDNFPGSELAKDATIGLDQIKANILPPVPPLPPD